MNWHACDVDHFTSSFNSGRSEAGKAACQDDYGFSEERGEIFTLSGCRTYLPEISQKACQGAVKAETPA
jgi:hypothetical protein